MAGVLEMVIFSVIDPADMQWLGDAEGDWSRQGIYAIGFVVCWVATGLSSALTAVLVREEG